MKYDSIKWNKATISAMDNLAKMRESIEIEKHSTIYRSGEKATGWRALYYAELISPGRLCRSILGFSAIIPCSQYAKLNFNPSPKSNKNMTNKTLVRIRVWARACIKTYMRTRNYYRFLFLLCALRFYLYLRDV